MRIALDEIEPRIWRRVEVPLGMSLKGPHDVIQAAMGWEGYHLYEFQVGDKRYGVPDPEWDDMRRVLSAKSTKLASLIERGVRKLGYVYDFGDDWRHTITVEVVAAADPGTEYPRFVEGMRRGPPEDVGGIDGYYEFLEAMASLRHQEHKRMRDWYGGLYDPEDIDAPVIASRISQLARRRTLGRAAYEKSKGRAHSTTKIGVLRSSSLSLPRY